MKKLSKRSNISPQALPPQFCRCAPVLMAGQSPSQAEHPLRPPPPPLPGGPPPAPPSHLCLGAGARDARSRAGVWAGGCGGKGGRTGPLQRSLSATPTPPNLAPSPPAGPARRAASRDHPREAQTFFSPNAKTFSRSSRWRAAALPAGPSPPSYFPPSCRSVG